MKARFFTINHRYCFICLLSIAVVCGAVSDSQAQSYYPDEFGNTWILRSTDGIDERIVAVEGPETIGTESLRVIVDRTNDNTSKFFIKTEPDGVLIFRAIASVAPFGAVSIDYSPPQIFLPVPIGLGSEWTVTGAAKLSLGIIGITIETTNDAKVVAIENVIVPAGLFRNCLKIEQQIRLSTGGAQFSPQNSTIWLAPDIGLVKAISTDNIIFELIRYEITTIDDTEVAVQPKEKLAITWGALKNNR